MFPHNVVIDPSYAPIYVYVGVNTLRYKVCHKAVWDYAYTYISPPILPYQYYDRPQNFNAFLQKLFKKNISSDCSRDRVVKVKNQL